ncbi:MAG: IPT/TIG domain-containing protein, partial [Planctomycetota bacterium]
AQNITAGPSNGLDFSFPDPPALTDLTPAAGVPGTVIDISGSGFHGSAQVSFEFTTLGRTLNSPSVTVVNDALVRAEVPNVPADIPLDLRLVEVTVSNSAGGPSNALEFTYAFRFIRGDINLDGVVDLSDPIKNLLGLFGGADIPCDEAADTNNDGNRDLSDSVFLLDFLFQDGPAMSAPFPDAGFDLDDDGISCDV